jgi:hypothetical protein
MVQMNQQNWTKDDKSKVKEEPAALKIAGFDVVVFNEINYNIYDWGPRAYRIPPVFKPKCEWVEYELINKGLHAINFHYEHDARIVDSSLLYI